MNKERRSRLNVIINMKEIWKDIEGYEGLYQVSNLGRVKSVDRYINGRINGLKSFIKGKLLIPVHNSGRKYKYLSVNLCINGNRKKIFVHRLVAQAFILNPNNYPCINHRDENPSNNCVDNLEWCSYKYNSNYGTLTERRKITQPQPFTNDTYDKLRRLLSKIVIQKDINNKIIKVYSSIKEASRITNIRAGNISNCANGRSKTAGGFKWSF